MLEKNKDVDIFIHTYYHFGVSLHCIIYAAAVPKSRGFKRKLVEFTVSTFNVILTALQRCNCINEFRILCYKQYAVILNFYILKEQMTSGGRNNYSQQQKMLMAHSLVVGSNTI